VAVDIVDIPHDAKSALSNRSFTLHLSRPDPL